MAIVHVAVFEVVNAIDRRYESYLRLPAVGSIASMEAGIAQAAHDTLVALYPSQKAHCDQLLAADLALIPNGQAKQAGILLGRVAAAILFKMRDDGSNHSEPLYGVDYLAGTGPGEWRQDPISLLPVALERAGAQCGRSWRPRGKAFRAPAPPPLSSAAYAAAYDEVKTLGGDGVAHADGAPPTRPWPASTGPTTVRPSLCAPPRLYNQITEVIATRMGFGRRRAGAAPRAGQRGDGRRRHRHLGIEVLLQGVAAGHRNPRGRSRDRPVRDRRSQSDRGDPTFTPLGAPASNLTARISRRRSRPIRPAMPASAARSSRPCATSTARRHRVHVRLRRVQRRDRRQRRRRPAAAAAQLRLVVTGRGRERPEPHLPRHPLVLRQDGGHQPGTARRRLRVRPCVPAAALNGRLRSRSGSRFRTTAGARTAPGASCRDRPSGPRYW